MGKLTTMDGTIRVFKTGDGTISFPTWQIGQVVKLLGRGHNSLRGWERDGYIDKPKFRVGGNASAVRAYTKGEIDLLVMAYNVWQKEHFLLTGYKVPPPIRERFKVIYHDMKEKGLKRDEGFFFTFELPKDYLLPETELSLKEVLGEQDGILSS